MEVLLLVAVAFVFYLLARSSHKKAQSQTAPIASSRNVVSSADPAAAFDRIISEHIGTLGREYAMLVRRDRYGVEDRTEWIRERDYFVAKVLCPQAGFGSSSAADTAKRMVDKAAALQAATLDDVRFSENMQPSEFERWCAQELERVGWRVTLTKATGDQGADVIAEKGLTRIVIQCKLYSSPVGNGAVQETFSAQRHYRADASAVVTNAGYTRAAEALAATTKVYLLHHSQLTFIDELLGMPKVVGQDARKDVQVELKQAAMRAAPSLADLGARIEAAQDRLKGGG